MSVKRWCQIQRLINRYGGDFILMLRNYSILLISDLKQVQHWDKVFSEQAQRWKDLRWKVEMLKSCLKTLGNFDVISFISAFREQTSQESSPSRGPGCLGSLNISLDWKENVTIEIYQIWFSDVTSFFCLSISNVTFSSKISIVPVFVEINSFFFSYEVLTSGDLTKLAMPWQSRHPSSSSCRHPQFLLW